MAVPEGAHGATDRVQPSVTTDYLCGLHGYESHGARLHACSQAARSLP